jgi:hypothetical protein
LVIVLIACALLLPVSSLPAQAYCTPDHPILTAWAVKTLDNDGRTNLVQVLEARDRRGDTLLEKVEAGSYDEDTLDLGLNHYYDPTTGEGLAGRSTNSADLCQAYFDTAVQQWQSGEFGGAAYTLGRAVHVVQDSTVPHHARLDPLNGHAEYESWLSARISFWLTDAGGLYDYGSNASEFVVKNALVAYDLFGKVILSNASLANYEEVQKIVKPLAIRSSAGFIDFFFRTVEGTEPELLITDTGLAHADLLWTPCADPHFLRYEVYVSDAEKKVVRDEAHLRLTIGDRDRNGAEVSGLNVYGTYEFQVVTVLEDGSLESNVPRLNIGFSVWLAVAFLSSFTICAVFLTLRSRRIRAKRRR